MAKQRKKMSTNVFCLVVCVLVVSSVSQITKPVQSPDPFFTLVAKTVTGSVYADYLNFLKQHVARISIDIDIVIQSPTTFLGELLGYRDFDICCLDIRGGSGLDPDFSVLYSENGSLNFPGYHTSMDWNESLNTGLNEWYLQEGKVMYPADSEERVNHYWSWEQYLMDKILPIQPLFSPRQYVAHWTNLEGYNYTDGLRQSFGKMYWDGSHVGQDNTSMVIIADNPWINLNPVYQNDPSSEEITRYCLDPLIWYDSDSSIWPHLASSYTLINDTHLRITCREGIQWEEDPDGLYPAEFFDAEDVYFTYYCMKELSPKKEQFKWIDEMSIVNATTLDFLIDGNPATPEKEPFAPLFTTFATSIIPEHYLNQTQELDGVTPDITHNSWTTFNSSCFGTGAFKIADYNEDDWTTLAIRDDSWFLNTTIISDPLLDWVRRFGDYSSGLEFLKVRIIPDIFVACLEFEAGKLDLCSITELRDKREQYEVDINFEIQSEIENKFIFFGYNMREVRPEMGNQIPFFKDTSISTGLALRKAISYALDREEINTVIHAGEYAITNWPIYSKMGIWCNPDIIQYNHDLDKARSYMFFQPWTPPDYDWLSTEMIILYASFCGILVISLSIIIPMKIRKRRNIPMKGKPDKFYIDDQ